MYIYLHSQEPLKIKVSVGNPYFRMQTRGFGPKPGVLIFAYLTIAARWLQNDTFLHPLELYLIPMNLGLHPVSEHTSGN